MEIILHVGAHRTGTSTLQMSLHKNKKILNNMGITCWGPTMTRNGLFSGLFRVPTFNDSGDAIRTATESKTNINARIERLSREGQSRLLVSEENIIGSMETNLGKSELYPDLFMRLAHLSSLFGDKCARIGLSIRSYDTFWSSSIAYAIKDGFYIPNQDRLIGLSYQKRTWRNVIEEVSELFPNAKIFVWNFNEFVGKNESIVKILTGMETKYGFQPLDIEKHNASFSTLKLRNTLLERGNIAAAQKFPNVDQVYMPFSSSQVDHMKARFLEDLDWLIAGADGVAQFIANASDINFQRNQLLNVSNSIQETKLISIENPDNNSENDRLNRRDTQPSVLASATDISRTYFCQNIPLAFGPQPAIPDFAVRRWLERHNAHMPENKYTPEQSTAWMERHPNALFFTVAGHPAKRAYTAFMTKIFSTTQGGYTAIRKDLERQYGLILPQGDISPTHERSTLAQAGYGVEEHRINFKLFLLFIAANLRGETDIRQDGKWQLQTEIIRRYGISNPEVIVIKEEKMRTRLRYLENRLNMAPILDWEIPAAPSYTFGLKEVYDREIEALMRSAYGPDYQQFGYGNFA